MKLYADHPVRRVVQVVADLIAVVVVVGAVWLATEVHDQVVRLEAPGERLIDAGTGLRDTFTSAADNASRIPLVGKALSDALHRGSDAGAKLGDAGQWQIDAVANLALWLAVIMVAVPVLFLLVTWLPLRWRFARRATAAARLRALGPDGLDLLALRALVADRMPWAAAGGRLTTTGWRDRDPETLALLARWELRRLGLRG
jgi:hypothetical protein